MAKTTPIDIKIDTITLSDAIKSMSAAVDKFPTHSSADLERAWWEGFEAGYAEAISDLTGGQP